MRAGTTSARPPVATDQHKRKLGLDIYRLLKSNASNARPVDRPTEAAIPDVGTKGLIRNCPVDAIRAEVGSRTLTVEITTHLHGEQYAPDVDSDYELRYAAKDLDSFRTWFADLLQRSGLSMLPPATATPREFSAFMADSRRPTSAHLRQTNTSPEAVDPPIRPNTAPTGDPKPDKEQSTALQRLTALDLEVKRKKYPGVPPAYIPKTKFEDRTANGLTKCITSWIKLHSVYAPRIQSQGQYNERLGRWTKVTIRRGTANVHAIVHGQHLSIEIKIGKDRQSAAQKKTAHMVARAGGHYYICRSFADFVTWFTALTSAHPVAVPLSLPQPI